MLLFICVSVCEPICVCVSVCVSIPVYLCLSISVCLSAFLTDCMSVCLFFLLSCMRPHPPHNTSLRITATHHEFSGLLHSRKGKEQIPYFLFSFLHTSLTYPHFFVLYLPYSFRPHKILVRSKLCPIIFLLCLACLFIVY